MTHFSAAVVLSLLAVPALAAPPTEEDREQLRKAVAAAIRHEGRPERAMSDRVRSWLRANAEALDGVRAGSLGNQPWGVSAHRSSTEPETPTHVYLVVFDWHVGGKLVVYGLTGGVRRAYLLSDAKQAALPATQIGSSTVFEVPKEPPDPLASVVVLELTRDKPETVEIVARPAAGNGRIHMHARDAIVHGVKLRYEPEPHKDTLGYWTEAADWASWDFEVTEPGTYSVEILQGCGKGSGGSTVNFAVGEQMVPVTVEDTGGFQNFVARRVGEFSFPKPGRYKLSAKPVHKAGKAVMDLRSVTLTRQK